MKNGLTKGLVAFAALTYLILIGLPTRLEEAALPVLAVLTALFFWMVLRGQARESSTGTLLSSGLTAGVTVGLLTALEIWFFSYLLGSGVKVQPVFDKIVPLNMAAILNVSAGTIAKAEVSFLQ
ncbi:MAG TPA: hypothetical protein PL105_12175, partial [Caldilineaceae bacterium]|nr:hypothetical protein [Caldilineaceae bacterium]